MCERGEGEENEEEWEGRAAQSCMSNPLLWMALCKSAPKRSRQTEQAAVMYASMS